MMNPVAALLVSPSGGAALPTALAQAGVFPAAGVLPDAAIQGAAIGNIQLFPALLGALNAASGLPVLPDEARDAEGSPVVDMLAALFGAGDAAGDGTGAAAAGAIAIDAVNSVTAHAAAATTESALLSPGAAVTHSAVPDAGNFLPDVLEAMPVPAVEPVTEIPLVAQARDALSDESIQSLLARIPAVPGSVAAQHAAPTAEVMAKTDAVITEARSTVQTPALISPEAIKPASEDVPATDDITRTIESNIFRLGAVEHKSPAPQQQAADSGINFSGKNVLPHAMDESLLPATAPRPVELPHEALKVTHGLKAHAPAPHMPVSIADQVSFRIAGALKEGEAKIHIQLEPANLGKVEVRIDLNADHKPNILVLADKQETLDLLQKDARALERALQDAGLKADAGNLNFSLREQRQNMRAQNGLEDLFGNGGALNPEALAAESYPRLPSWMIESSKALDMIV